MSAVKGDDYMEAYIRVNKDNNMVTFIHRRPFDPVNGLNETREELLKTGYFVDEIEAPETLIGRRATAYYDHERKKVYYKYTATPLSTRERLDMLEAAMNAQIVMNAIRATKEE